MVESAVEPKKGADVGRIVVDVLVENFEDRLRAGRGEISKGEVRRVTVRALVGSGATFFCLPGSIVEKLGLAFRQEKESRTVTGPIRLGVYAPARIEVQGRDCVTQVLALPEDRQASLGQIPLEMMDWWIDPRAQRLVGNPEHGGEWQAEVY
jgi:predicted aspartyl protease